MHFELDDDENPNYNKSDNLSLWNSINGMSLEKNSSINNIDSNLFQIQEKKWDLDKFFNEKETSSNFVKNQLREIESNLNKNLKYLVNIKDCIYYKSEKFKDEKIFKNFEKNSSNILQNSFSSHFKDIFKLPKKNEDYINKIISNYFKFCFHSFTDLLKHFHKFLNEDTISQISKNSVASKKRIPWSEKEEKELIEIMEKQHPYQISNLILTNFSGKYNRTKSAIVNKIQKLKKKHSRNFMKKSDQIISDSINVNENSISLKTKILNVLSKNPIPFEEILKSLHITETEIQTEESVNEKLYDLMNKKKINSKESFFIEFSEDFKLYRKNNKSIIVKFLVDFMLKEKLVIVSLDKAKFLLGKEFQEMDLNKKDFDFELMSFLKNSMIFIVRHKRVFYL